MVDEAAAAMVRTSFSTLVRESYDFSCVITDAAGQSLVQASESIPSFIGTLPETVKHFLRFFPPDQLAPGDVLITNDIWLGTGHLPDITLAKPIFLDGRLVAFSATTAHAPDIGGKIRSPEPREVFEEGLQIPPMKMIAAGKTDETLVTIIRKNVRTPDQTMGDLWAQVVALDLMEDRLRNLMEGYGLPDLTDLAREIQGRCETAMRAAIRELPDGTYRSELKTDGLMETPITLRMELTIKGDEIMMDFAGTDAQVDRAINCALCYTNAMAMYGVKVCTSPNLPNNEGAWRPITLKAPEGCIVNPQFPAPGGSRMLIGHYVPMLVFGCLGQIVPERVMAACGSPMWGMNQSGVRDDGKGGGKPYANMFFYNGGMGGNTRRDGVTCLSLAVQRQLDLDRDQRAHRAAALPSQEAAPRFGRRRPPSRRSGPGDPDRKPQRHADRRVVPRRADPVSGVRHRRRQGRRAGRAANQRQEDRSQEAVRREQGRHRLARHAGRRRPRRSAPARARRAAAVMAIRASATWRRSPPTWRRRATSADAGFRRLWPTLGMQDNVRADPNQRDGTHEARLFARQPLCPQGQCLRHQARHRRARSSAGRSAPPIPRCSSSIRCPRCRR